MKFQIAETKKSFLDKGLFGIFFEDINYGADGGLYAEMIENRQFAFLSASIVGDREYATEACATYGWESIGGLSVEVQTVGALTEENPHYLRLGVKGGQGICNKAYDGVYMEPGKDYRVKLYLRTHRYDGKLTFVVWDGKTREELVTCAVCFDSSTDWTCCELCIRSDRTIRGGKPGLLFDAEGEVDLGYVSMMPSDAVAGIFRKDLFELLQNLKPGFLRFPGGCIVEGANLSNRYRWKDTVGDVIHRKWNWNRWAVHEPMIDGEKLPFFSQYNQSYGIGFYEYFLLSEMLGANPIPVLNVGLACQYQSYELVEIDTPEFETFVQDALDLIEFANGDSDTRWGSLRAAMGHPESFGLRYLGIGNEQWETEKVDFFARYERFEEAIHEKYPDIELLGTVGPDVISEHYTSGWEFYRSHKKQNKNFVTAVDEHYYMPPKWFLENSHFYDNYPRDIAVFAGEFAAHNEAKSNNWESALSEAAFMTGLERNGDVIQLASAAPLFARYGYTQWQPDLIWFDDCMAMATPSYYVQQMYGCYTGNRICEVTSDVASDRVYVSATSDETHYYVKLANVTEDSISVELLLTEGDIIWEKRIDLQAEDWNACNRIGNEGITPKTTAMEETNEQVVAPNSFVVFVGKK